MPTSELTLNENGEYVKDGRVFRPVYKHLLDSMPKDLVQEMARRRLAELDAAQEDEELSE
ncbi:MAG: hypothetical protein LBG93_09960 [Treponema sp.]|jgi:hypothetical protein|nr:hypothetical protein [Treponema sp.]